MKAGRAGFTIIEVVISILLTATLVSAVFSIALTSQSGGMKTDRKMLAGQAERALSAALRSYVTADRNNPRIAGPNACARTGCGVPGAASWNIHTPGVQTDSAGDVYALSPFPAAGTTVHTLSCVAAPGPDVACFLPKVLREPPISATISYTVYVSAANVPPRVTVTVDWNDL